jgi:hypothetical protein
MSRNTPHGSEHDFPEPDTESHAEGMPSTEEVMAEVRALNEAGTHVIFAPNHLIPEGKFAKLRQTLVLADDYPALQRFLKAQGISACPVMRGDMDIQTDSTLKRKVYDIHRKVFSAIGHLITGGVPVAINEKDTDVAKQSNTVPVRELLRTVDRQNLVMYPWAKWYQAGTQQFDEEKDVPKKRGEEPDTDGHIRLKRGFTFLSRHAGAPIVPVYADRKGEEIQFRFGSLLRQQEGEGDAEMSRRYIQSMQQLKQGEGRTDA